MHHFESHIVTMPSSCLVIIPTVHLILILSHAIMPQVHLSANNLNDPDSEQMLKHSNLRQIYLSCNPIKVDRTTIYLSYVIATIIYFQYVHISHLTQPHPGLLESFPSPNLQLFKVNQMNVKICLKTLRRSMNHLKQQIWTVPNFLAMSCIQSLENNTPLSLLGLWFRVSVNPR